MTCIGFSRQIGWRELLLGWFLKRKVAAKLIFRFYPLAYFEEHLHPCRQDYFPYKPMCLYCRILLEGSSQKLILHSKIPFYHPGFSTTSIYSRKGQNKHEPPWILKIATVFKVDAMINLLFWHQNYYVFVVR